MESAVAAEEATVLGAAQAEAAATLSAAERDAAAIEVRLHGEAAASVRALRAQLEAEAEIQTEARQARDRDVLVEKAFARAAEILQTSREVPGYPSVLEALVREAEDQFPPDQALTIRCDGRDAALVRQLIESCASERSIDASLASWGGVKVTDTAGSIVCDNTLEGRLERARELLRWEVGAIVLAISHPD